MHNVPYWLIIACLVVSALATNCTTRYRNRNRLSGLGRKEIIHKAMQAGAARGRSDAIQGKPAQYDIKCPDEIYKDL